MIAYLFNIQTLTIKDLNHFFQLLPSKEINNIINYKNKKKQISKLIGRLILLYILKKHFNYNGEKLPYIKYTNYGKPFLDDFDIEFSFSYSLDMVLCGFSKNCKIGADIEFMKFVDLNDYSEIFTFEEMAFILKSENLKYSFYKHWTRKEALLKAIGKGFLLNPALISVLSKNINGSSWYFHTQSFKKQYLISIVAEIECFLHIEELHSLNFLDSYLTIQN